jgi:hypothetical protein
MSSNNVAERRRALINRIQTEGAEAAYAAALEVCLDPKAPSPARATCATTILRAGGYLSMKPGENAPKEPHEMTPQELDARIQELRSSTGRTAGEDTGNGVFD